jgi:hypothetical protein
LPTSKRFLYLTNITNFSRAGLWENLRSELLKMLQ